MPERPPSSRPDENATQLFAEYIASRESGGSPDLDALCARAGTNAEELRRRIRALSVLDDLGDALREEEEDGDEGVGARAATAGAAVIPRLGPYENLRLLGEGGLSRVYVAFDPDLQREVALKVIANEQIPRGAARDWMLREGRSVARLQHPNVVRVFALGQTDDALQTYVAMELVDGPSLADVRDELRARKRGGAPLSADPRVRAAADRYSAIGARAALALRIARALAACHTAEVLHRDVKPGNVLLDPDGEPKLIDFGLAHLSQDGAGSQHVTQRLIGTPAYIAPEQVESGMTGADPRSDQFSFGVLLYELLTLEAPFQRGTRTQTIDAVSRALPTAPHEIDAAIPVDLETICLHALEREPGDRYPSMDALADDLEAFLDHRAIAIRPPGVARRCKLWVRRNRRDVLLLGIPTLALACGVLVYLWIRTVGAHAAANEAIANAVRATPKLAQPFEVQAAFSEAVDLESRARDADQHFLARWFLSELRPRSREYLHAVSDRLAELLAARRSEYASLPPPPQADAENELLHTWKDALTLDATLCPECRGNADDRERGRIDLPEPPADTRLEVLRMRPATDPRLCTFVPHEAGRQLGVGEFRLRWLDDASLCLAEVDLSIQPRSERALLNLRPVPDAVRARLVHVPAGSVLVPGGRDQTSVPEFWAYTGWCTATDLQEHLTAKTLTPDDTLEVYGTPKKVLRPAHAAYVAREVSARLPSLPEAVRLLQLTREGALGLEPLPSEFDGEYCSGWPSESGRVHLTHGREPDRHDAVANVRDAGRPDKLGPFAFRLVISSAPSP